MAEYLAAPGQANQVIVLEHAAMGLEIPTRNEREDETFVPQTDQLYQIASLRMGRLCIPEHAAILPYPHHLEFYWTYQVALPFLGQVVMERAIAY